MIEVILVGIKWLSLFCAAIIVFSIVLTLLRRYTHPLVLLLLAVVHGLVCFILILTFFNSGLDSAEENSWLFRSVRFYNQIREKKLTIEEQPFILVDNSGNKMLITDELTNKEDSISLVVTDRRKLANFLENCADNEEYILTVVCDIRFDEPSDYDELLKHAISRLSSKNKIILAGSSASNANALALNPHLFGTVDAKLNDNIITNFVLFDEAEMSLPYLLYLKAEGKRTESKLGLLSAEVDGSGNSVFVRNSINPSLGLGNRTDDSDSLFLKNGDSQAMSLGYFLSDLGKFEFLNRLKNCRDRKPIIFIGEFEGSGSLATFTDYHGTLSGSMHGSRILINIFNDLRVGGHRLFHWILLVPLIYFIFISIFIFRKAYEYPRSIKEDFVTNKIEPTSPVLMILKETLKGKFKDLLFITSLLIAGVISIVASGIIINIFALLGYFMLLEAMFCGIMLNRKKLKHKLKFK